MDLQDSALNLTRETGVDKKGDYASCGKIKLEHLACNAILQGFFTGVALARKYRGQNGLGPFGQVYIDWHTDGANLLAFDWDPFACP